MRPTDTIACFKSGSLTKGGPLPDRLLAVPWGSKATNQGDVVCNTTTLAVLAGNQELAKYDRVALDFQHNTVPGTKHYRGEPAAVAAFGTPQIVEGEGIFLTDLEWTEEGKKYAPEHYPDVSPAVKRNDKGEVYFLHSVALCRQGEIDGLTLFSASTPNHQLMKTDLNNLDPAAVRKTLNVFRAALGMAEVADDAAPDAILSATTEAVDKVTALAKAVPPAKEKKDEPEAKPGAEVTALNARLDAMERANIVATASRDGKVIPLTPEQIAETPITTLSGMVAQLKPTVPMEGKTSTDTNELAVFSAGGKPSPEMDGVMKRLGLSAEDMKKYGNQH